MAFLLLLPLALLIPIPFSLRLIRSHITSGTLGAGPFRFQFQIRSGRLIFISRKRSKPAASPSAAQLQQLRVLLRADHARKLLRRFVHLHSLVFRLRLSLADAARCALTTGGLRGLTAFIPPKLRSRVHVCIQPDFFTGRSEWYLACMVSVPLGILLITGVMTVGALLKEKRAASPVGKEA